MNPNPRIPSLTIHPAVGAHLQAGVVAIDGVVVESSGAEIESALADLETRLAGELADVQPADLPVIRAVRAMFHALRIDPTRTRPSSEALLRRVLKGKGLYRISNAVDVCNLCSLESLLPMGLYDRSAIEGDILMALGEPGAAFDGIRKDTVHVAERPTLSDDRGPFGAPTSDSFRTRVHAGTESLLLVVYAPAGLGTDDVRAAVENTARRYKRLCGGVVRERRLIASTPNDDPLPTHERNDVS